MEGGFVFLSIMGCLMFVALTCIVVAGIIRGVNDDSPSPKLKCERDYDCSYWEECIKGLCYMTCRNKKCPRNERCISFFHTATCECLPGYVRIRNSTCRNNVIKPTVQRINTTRLANGTGKSS